MTVEPHIDYEALAQAAMRAVVRTVLLRVAKSGLPGEHHFYIAFNTTALGVIISDRLREKYPEEMTVVLQHRFWDLAVTDERFEVNLTFDSIPERLVVPFAAVKVFFDPSVPYGLQFEDSDLMGSARGSSNLSPDDDMVREPERTRPSKRGSQQAEQQGPALVRPEKRSRQLKRAGLDKSGETTVPALEKPAQSGDKSADAPQPATGPKVVKLDAFRKK
jgi:uncharacterized protein